MDLLRTREAGSDVAGQRRGGATAGLEGGKREDLHEKRLPPGEYNQPAPCQSVGSFQVLILSLMVCLYHYPMPW